MTSHSAQGATADRMLVHIDTCSTHRDLVNSRLVYVAVSRGRYDARIYTNNVDNLSRSRGHEVSKRSAMEGDQKRIQLRHERPGSLDRDSTGNSFGHAGSNPAPSRGFEMER